MQEFFYLDREAWVMLVGFPEDLRNPMVITKSVSTFGILVYWHDSENLTRVVVKVYLNDEGKIPGSVKVNAGAPYKGRSWTVPVFVLKKNGVTVVPDEEVYVIEGPFHPMPFQPPRWTGPTNPARSNATPVDSQADNLMDIEADGNRAPTVGRQGNQVVAAFEPVDENVVLQEMLSGLVLPDPVVAEEVVVPPEVMSVGPLSGAPSEVLNVGLFSCAPMSVSKPLVEDSLNAMVINHEVIDVATQEAGSSALALVPKPRLKSIVVCLNQGLNLDLNKVLSFTPKALPPSFLSFLSTLDISLDTDIPLFFDDPLILVCLACLLPPQITDVTPDEALEAMKVAAEAEKEGEDLVEIPKPADFTPGKRRARKLLEPLDVQFLRRSKRTADKLWRF